MDVRARNEFGDQVSGGADCLRGYIAQADRARRPLKAHPINPLKISLAIKLWSGGCM